MSATHPLRNYSLQLLSGVASGILFFLSTGLHPVPLFTWISPVPVFLASLSCKPPRALLLGFVAYLIGGLNLITYLLRLSTPAFAIAVLLIISLVFGIILCFSSWVHRNSGLVIASVLAFPAIWTSFEFLLSIYSANGSALSWAYYQSDFIPLIQIASVTGHLGITFLQLFIASSLAHSLHFFFSEQKISKAFMPAITAAVVFQLVLSFGFYRLSEPQKSSAIKATLISIGTTNKFFDTKDRDVAIGAVSSYTDEIDAVASSQDGIVVLPEKIVGVTDEYKDSIQHILSRCAIRDQVMIVAGVNRMRVDSMFNEAWVFGPDGSLIADYRKTFFVPGLEAGYTPGRSVTTFPFSGLRCGIQICKDMDFPLWSQQYGKENVNLMLIPAWDFVADGDLHARMAMMRGIENGFSELRCAQEGNLTFSDSYGRIIQERKSGAPSPTVITAKISGGNGSTFYSSYGELFGWSNMILVIVIAGLTIFRRKKLYP